MRIAFYAPMKPPDHPVPSGDRRMARLLMAALGQAGHQVELASRLRSWQAEADPGQQARLTAAGQTEADRLLAAWAAAPATAPRLWFTYHLYYKAPDWIGPQVAEALDIPYVLAEASLAPKRAEGPWAVGHQAVLAALSQATAVITLNPADAACLPEPAKVRPLPPFLDPTPFAAARRARDDHRRALAARHGLASERPWLLAVAMMRPGDKLASYRVLSAAIERLRDRDWQLLLVGDGPAAAEVRAAFAWAGPDRVRWLGQQTPEDLPDLYGASDLLVWPAVNEAYGMALLEAQAAGLPVVAGRSPGVAAIVADGTGGLLVEPGAATAFTDAVAVLLDDPARRHAYSAAAATRVRDHHGMAAASRALDDILRGLGAP